MDNACLKNIPDGVGTRLGMSCPTTMLYLSGLREAYGDVLVELGKTNSNIVVLDADLWTTITTKERIRAIN